MMYQALDYRTKRRTIIHFLFPSVPLFLYVVLCTPLPIFIAAVMTCAGPHPSFLSTMCSGLIALIITIGGFGDIWYYRDIHYILQGPPHNQTNDQFACAIIDHCIKNSFSNHQQLQKITSANYYLKCVLHQYCDQNSDLQQKHKEEIDEIYELYSDALRKNRAFSVQSVNHSQGYPAGRSILLKFVTSSFIIRPIFFFLWFYLLFQIWKVMQIYTWIILSIFLLLEILKDIILIYLYRLARCWLRILPFRWDQNPGVRINFDEMFDSVEDMMLGIDMVHYSMFTQWGYIDKILKKIDDVFDDDIISVIAQYLWLPLPSINNFEEFTKLQETDIINSM